MNLAHNNTVKYKKTIFTIRDIWHDNNTKYHDADIIYYQQVKEPIGNEHEVFYSIINDLDQSKEEIFENISKNTRYKINRATNRDKLNYNFYRNFSLNTLNDFFKVYNQLVKIKKIRPIDKNRILAYYKNKSLVLSNIKDENENTLVWHVYRLDNKSSFLIYTVSTWFKYQDSKVRNKIARANLFCHWMDILNFKEMGGRYYDFGGWYHKKDDSEKLKINSFKEQFGGQVIKFYNCIDYPTFIGKLFWILKKIKNKMLKWKTR